MRMRSSVSCRGSQFNPVGLEMSSADYSVFTSQGGAGYGWYLTHSSLIWDILWRSHPLLKILALLHCIVDAKM